MSVLVYLIWFGHVSNMCWFNVAVERLHSILLRPPVHTWPAWLSSLVVATDMCWCFSLRNEGVAVTMLYSLSSWVPQIPIHSFIVINNQSIIFQHKLPTTCRHIDYIWMKLCLLQFLHIVYTSCLNSIYILSTPCIHRRYITLHLQIARVSSLRYLRVLNPRTSIWTMCFLININSLHTHRHWLHFVILEPMLSTLLQL